MTSKIRIHTDNHKLSGYDNYRNINIHGLEDSLKNYDFGELDEIILDDIIDYIPIDKAEEMLIRISKTLKKGGLLVVRGTDLYDACKAFANYNIDIVEANKIIFGDDPNNTKKLSFTTTGISGFLSTYANMKILKKRVHLFNYEVEAQRL
jgi:hypothetical protein